MLVVDKNTGTVQHRIAADTDEEAVIHPEAFDRLSPAAKAKYLGSSWSSRTSSDERIQPFWGGADARTGAPRASPRQSPRNSPGFEHKANWLTQQVKHYGTSVQDFGAVPEAVAYSNEHPMPKSEPTVLRQTAATSPRILPVLYQDGPNKEAVRTLMAMTLGLRLEHCRPASKEVSAGLRVDYVTPDSVSAAVPPSDQIKVGDVIIFIQDYSVETIPEKTAAEAVRLFGKRSDGSISVLSALLRLRLLRPDPGFNELGGINWTEHEVTLVRPAHMRNYKHRAAEISDVDYRPSTIEFHKHYVPHVHHAQPLRTQVPQTYHAADWSDALDFATKAARHFEDTEMAKQRASEMELRQEARKELEAQVDQHLKEALEQLHNIDKKDLLEHKEFVGKHAQDEGAPDAALRAQRLLDQETYLDYERLRAENERLQLERDALDRLRRENQELKEGINFENKKILNAERVDKGVRVCVCVC
jgi:hypothetical protein